MTSFAALRDRYLADVALGGTGASPALTRALEAIGWRSVREPTPEELAGELVMLIDDCVRGHRDLSALERGIAGVLRDCGPLLDGGLPPVEAYLPAAEELLQRYARNNGTDDARDTPIFDGLN